MATTTNYGWTTPDDTSLVKDGASAIRTLGSSVDTTVKNLNPETTLGDISYRSSTANTNTRLAIGTTGQVLAVSGGVPAWTTISSGGMTLISETTATALSSLSLSSIPGTYKQLLLVWSGIQHSASGSTFGIRFNNNSGSIYEYSSLYALGTAGVLQPDGNVGQGDAIYAATFYFPFGRSQTGSDLYQTAMGFLLIDNYASATKLKTYETHYSAYDAPSSYVRQIVNYRGIFNSTSAITSIDVVRLSGTATFSNITNTSIRLYGIS
jgi:hypothetical protein